MIKLASMASFNFSWMELCGPEGLVPWYPTRHDIGICFQKIFLEVPVLIMFAVTSAYYYGNNYLRRTTSRQRCLAICFRFIISSLIAVLPIIQEILNLKFAHSMLREVDILISGVKIITWFVHSGYVLTLRHELNINGPVLCRVLWTLTAVLAAINVRSQALINRTTLDLVSSYNFKFSVALLVLQILYALTFIPFMRKSESNQTLFDNHTQFSEHSHLLGSSFYQGFREDMDPDYLGIAMEDTTIVSKLIFAWVDPLIKKGVENKVRTCDDLFDLPVRLSTSVLCNKVRYLISNEESERRSCYGATDVTVMPRESFRNQKTTIFKALHKSFSFQFYSIGILKFLSDVLGFAGPILLNKLVSFIEEKNEPIMWGYLYAGGLFLTTFVKAFLIVHFNFLMAQLGLKLRGALISNIYRKVLVSSSSTVNKFSIGEIINFISTDTDRIVNSCASFHSFWSIPFQIAVTFYLLNEQIGIAFLAGVAFTILLIPINKFIASKIGYLSAKLMHYKDERVASMAEILRGIRVLKLHVWEEHFLEKVFNIRRSELQYLKGRKYLDALCVYFWATTPIVISVLTFATYYLLGNQLKAASVFTTLALLNMVIGPLNAFPWILNGLTEAWVSLKRIQRFFDEKDSNLKDFFDSEPIEKGISYKLNDCTFNWTAQEAESKKEENSDNADAYNSLLGLKIRSKRRRQVSEEEPGTSTAKVVPVEPKLNFSLTNITLNVKTGSLVAVIGPVASGKTSFLAALLGEMNKIKGDISMSSPEGGCALVTQTPWLQRGTLRDNVLFGKNYDGTWYQTVINACCLTPDLESFRNGDTVLVGDEGMTLSAGQRARVALARATYQNKDIYLLDDVLSSVDVQVARHLYSKVICGLLKDKTRIFCTNHTQLLSNADLIIRLDQGSICAVGKPLEILPEFDELAQFEQESWADRKEIFVEKEKGYVIEDDEEARETSAVSLKVWQKYCSSMGHFIEVMIILSLILMQSSRNVTDYWLSEWVSAESNSNVTRVVLSSYISSKSYMTGYILLAVMNTLFTLLRAFVFAYGGITAATKIHEKLVRKVVSSKMTFHDITPLGRILNRFSSDTYTIDETLPFILNILLAQFFGLVGALVVTVSGNPWLCLIFAPLIPIYNYVQNNYRHTSRELKRLSFITLSPLYSHINETLQGLVVIRAFRCLPRFIRVNEEFLENNQKTLLASEAANQWLNLRLQMVGVAIVSAVGLIAVLQHEFDVVDAAVVGLAMSYSLSMTLSLNYTVTAFTETEKEMVSMERVGQYIDEIQSEPQGGNDPPYAWPSQGVIVFESVYLKYREHLIPSLNGVSFETRPAEKIGVVGRTGAGKSSLIVALLRLVQISGGKILIDTVNINTLSLQGLRTRIAVIPLDPFLFNGTIRDNLDPLGEYRDNEIWAALDKCHVKGVTERCGGLDTKVSGGGKMFSQGQRQLLCLVRAVLQNAKIVCLDEATASVDPETDKQIQQTIRSCFRQSTVLTIAHRISTIMDSDRVLVLRDGEIIEFDAPGVLALDKNSYFHQLRQEEIHQRVSRSVYQKIVTNSQEKKSSTVRTPKTPVNCKIYFGEVRNYVSDAVIICNMIRSPVGIL